VADALAAVQARTSGGKIVIYPMLSGVGMLKLPDLESNLPGVAAALDHGLWTRAAEEALLAVAGPGASATAGTPGAGRIAQED
jgi:hypothetical protein